MYVYISNICIGCTFAGIDFDQNIFIEIYNFADHFPRVEKKDCSNLPVS